MHFVGLLTQKSVIQRVLLHTWADGAGAVTRYPVFTCTKLHTCHTFRVNIAGIQYRQEHRVNPLQLKANVKRSYISTLRIRFRVACSFR